VACVLVHIEAEGDRPTAASLGALGAGRRLATRFGATVYAVVLTAAQSGDSAPPEASIRIGPIDPGTLGRAPLVGALAKGGADKVVFVTAEVVQQPTLWATAGNALASACESLRPLVVLVPTSRGGHDLAPRLAARLGAAYIPDAIVEGGDGPAGVQRFVYGGHTRRWVLDDLDRAAVIAVADGTPAARGVDDAEVMLLPAAADADDRVQLVTAASPAAAPAAPADHAGIVVLVRGLLSGPGTRAAAPLGGAERAAIDAAVALGAARGAPVIAIAAGAAQIHERALAAALAAGCARAIRIEAPIADEIDYLGLAQILAQATRKVGAAVIFCGDRSGDEATGAVGPAVAELIDAAHLTGVDGVEADGGRVIAHREPDRFRIAPPAVLAIAAPAGAGGAAATAGDAAADGIEVMTLDALGLDPRVLTHRRATSGAITSTSTVETVPGIPIPDFGPEPP
jgi:electron transfer flavoprotein alpha/beta subunit